MATPGNPAAGRTLGSVLVVDDAAAVRDLLRDVLLAEGYAVATAASGVEALEQTRWWRPDAVVLDVMLPRLDGFAVADVLRHRFGPELPIVLISANAGAAQRARQLGLDRPLLKPFDLTDLLQALQTATTNLPRTPVPEPRPTPAREPAPRPRPAPALTAAR